MFSEFLRCLVIGFTLASVIGPISVLCINQTIKNGFWSGFSSSLGASTADAIYGAIAAFGFLFVINFLLEFQIFLKVCGGAALLYLGIKFLISQNNLKSKIAVKKQHFLQNYFMVFGLTMANPLTIMLFLSAFSAIGNGVYPFMMSLGVFFGSILSYLVLISFSLFVKKKSNEKILHWINRFSSLIIIFFAIYAISDAFIN